MIAAADLAAGASTTGSAWLQPRAARLAAHAGRLSARPRRVPAFLAGHLGQPAGLADLARWPAADFRAWLAARGATELTGASTARALSVRAQLLPLPRPARPRRQRGPRRRAHAAPAALGAQGAHRRRGRGGGRAVGDLGDAPWIAKRDTAILALLYGCGLRLGEALALNAATARGARRRDPDPHVIGKGRKQRAVPVLPAVRGGDRGLSGGLPLRRRCATRRCSAAPAAAGSIRGWCSCACSSCGALLGLPEIGDAARAAPQLRHPSAGRRRRSARDPGAAGPRLAVDHAALHRGRRRGAARGLRQGPSARPRRALNVVVHGRRHHPHRSRRPTPSRSCACGRTSRAICANSATPTNRA